MPFYYVVLVILVIVIIVSVFLNLLFNPIVWIIIGGLMLWSWIRRYLYAKKLEEFNKEFTKRTQQKKEYYYENKDNTYNQRGANDDVIDVNYTVVDEENGDD